MKQKQLKKTPQGISIGDVAKICHIPDHTIRYWEREFAGALSPARTRGKQRRYTEEDMKKLLQIKRLLWIDKFSIEGARRILQNKMTFAQSDRAQNLSLSDTHRLAMQIALLISEQLTHAESAA